MDSEAPPPIWPAVLVILVGVGAILCGALFGIIFPVMATAGSGEVVYTASLQGQDSQSLTLDPSMNPLRATIDIDYDAPGRRLSGNHCFVKAQLHRGDLEVWSIQTGFDDRRPMQEDGRFVRPGPEQRTVSLGEISVTQAAEHTLNTEIDLDESFTFIGATLEVRRNVQLLDFGRAFEWIILIPLGIGMILFAAWRLATRRRRTGWI